MKPESEIFVLSRTGKQPIRFKGQRLADVSENGTRVALYRTAPDPMYRVKYIVHAVTRRGSRLVYEHVAYCARPGEVQDLVLLAGVDLATRVLLEADLPAPKVLIEDLS